MDLRSLLAIPLAALALSASSADSLRLPTGWQGGGSFALQMRPTYAWGVAPETERQPLRALTVQSLGPRQSTELGAVWQNVLGYAGKRVRFTAEVKATGTDTWAGLVVREGVLPLYLLPTEPDDPEPGFAAAACADWCRVSVVADMPAEGMGFVTVGIALLGNGQVWARGFQLEAVDAATPLTPTRFAPDQAAALRAQIARTQREQAARPTPPSNLSLR